MMDIAPVAVGTASPQCPRQNIFLETSGKRGGGKCFAALAPVPGPRRVSRPLPLGNCFVSALLGLFGCPRIEPSLRSICDAKLTRACRAKWLLTAVSEGGSLFLRSPRLCGSRFSLRTGRTYQRLPAAGNSQLEVERLKALSRIWFMDLNPSRKRGKVVW
jgi:hypothetical protein